MAERCDIVIAGLGIYGAALAAELSERGRRVIGLDRYDPPHTFGSSHGRSRVIRAAYFEDPLYVPLAQDAFRRWARLERAAGEQLLRRTGALMIGPASGEVVAGTLESARTHGIEHECLRAEEVRRRFPALTPPASDIAVFEPGAGMLAAERCHTALLRRAAAQGAQLRTHEPLVRWSSLGNGDGVAVETGGARIECDQLILSVGAWLPAHLPALAPRLTVERQAVAFFEPVRSPARLRADACPIVLWEYERGRMFYTLPDAGDGVKAALHHQGETTNPESVNRRVSDDELATLQSLLRRLQPDAAGPVRDALVCLYTNTPDEHFVVDALPEQESVLVVSACSGHGFKFALAIAACVADRLTGRPPAFRLDAFAVSRFGREPVA